MDGQGTRWLKLESKLIDGNGDMLMPLAARVRSDRRDMIGSLTLGLNPAISYEEDERFLTRSTKWNRLFRKQIT